VWLLFLAYQRDSSFASDRDESELSIVVALGREGRKWERRVFLTKYSFAELRLPCSRPNFQG